MKGMIDNEIDVMINDDMDDKLLLNFGAKFQR